MDFDASGPGRAAIWAILALSRARHAPERALIFYYILCEVLPSTELIIRDRCSEILPKLLGGGPGTTAPRPLGEMGCFWTTFLEFDPSKLGISPSKKAPPVHWGDLSNALAFLARAPFLSATYSATYIFFWRRAMLLDMR